MNKDSSETYLTIDQDRSEKPGITYIESDANFASMTSEENLILNPGQTIADNYIVTRQMTSIGAQSTVYLARRNGEVCVIKLYNPGYKPVESILELIKSQKCPYIAELLDYGYQKNRFYEIYRYYSQGTLSDEAKYSRKFINDIVVPNLNEGLYYLHTLGGSGIVHGDIKPSNIFITDDRNRVVIGDFGVSTVLDQNGKLIDDFKGTPEYSPRLVSFYGKAVKTPAYDYVSLGLVLIKLATGHSLFEGMDTIGINHEWERGLQIPTSLDTRLKDLVNGLTMESTDKRFGYIEVKKWCDGEYITVKKPSTFDKKYFEKNEVKPFVFGIFDNKVIAVSNQKDLFEAITAHWEHAKKVLLRESFYEFITQLEPDKEIEFREIGKKKDLDEMVFCTLYQIQKNRSIFYKGRNLGTFESIIRNDSEVIELEVLQLMSSGLIEHYLKCNDVDDETIMQVSRIISATKVNPKVMMKSLNYIFSKQKTLEFGASSINSLDEMGDLVSKMDIETIESFAKLPQLIAWLIGKGFQEEAEFLLNYKDPENEQ